MILKAHNMKICFFSVGFAFNRLVRLRYYEKIFPKDVEMFLITTDKYSGTKEENYQAQWDLKRTKIILMKYHPIKLLFEVRKFCQKNKINIVTNMGHPFGMIPLIFGSIGSKRKKILYFFGDTLETPKIDTFSKIGIRTLSALIPYFLITRFADKIAFNGQSSTAKAPVFFLLPKSRFYCLHAPVNVKLFHQIDKQKVRKELGLNPKDKIIIYVGRVTRRKAGHLLSSLIKNNPDVTFLIIGKWIEEEIPKPIVRNLKTFNKIPNEQLYKYYSAADLAFAAHLQGYSLGITAEEALACGTPVLHIEKLSAPGKTSAIIKIPFDVENANKKVRAFFELPDNQKKALSKEARSYAEKYCSDEVWKDRYLDFYLN